MYWNFCSESCLENEVLDRAKPEAHGKTRRMEPALPGASACLPHGGGGTVRMGRAGTPPCQPRWAPRVLCGGCVNPRCGLTFRACGWCRRGGSVRDSSKMWTPNMGQEVTALWVAWGQGSSQKKNQSLVNQRNCPECREPQWLGSPASHP